MANGPPVAVDPNYVMHPPPPAETGEILTGLVLAVISIWSVVLVARYLVRLARGNAGNDEKLVITFLIGLGALGICVAMLATLIEIDEIFRKVGAYDWKFSVVAGPLTDALSPLRWALWNFLANIVAALIMYRRLKR